MSSNLELLLLSHVTSEAGLKSILAENFNSTLLYTLKHKSVLEFALGYYKKSKRAPTEEVLAVEFPGLKLETSEESVGWLIEQLRKRYSKNELQALLAIVATKSVEDPVEASKFLAGRSSSLTRNLISAQSTISIKGNTEDRLSAYLDRATHSGKSGMIFGWEDIDEATYGIQSGELAILAALPKTGKTYTVLQAAVACAREGQTVFVSSLEMDEMQMAQRVDCLVSGVSPRRYQRGQLGKEELLKVKTAFKDLVDNLPGDIIIDDPKLDERTPELICQKARSFGASAVIIDQLSFLKSSKVLNSRTETIEYMLRELKENIKGEDPLPCILVSQFNRATISSQGLGGLHNLALSASIEATADWVFALYQSKEMKNNKTLHFGIIGSRREDLGSFDMNWNLTTACELFCRGMIEEQ